MPRIGSALLAVVLAAAPASAEVEFTMQADRAKVGTEDTFRLEIVVANAPEGAVLQFPAPEAFEVLGRSESTQMSYSVGPGGAGVMKQVRKHTLTLRANRVGTLTIPPAALQTAKQLYKTGAVTLEVVKGRLAPDRPQRRVTSPFGFPPGFPFDLDDPLGQQPPEPFDEPAVPRGDGDLFLRMALDKPEVYVGEQVSLTIHVYSRIDLASVETVTMPRLEGFWAQDSKSPSQLIPEQRVINGVPYREYLLRHRVLFPMKAGEITIDAPEADLTTGVFYAGRRVHRKGNPVKLTVKPLPPGGATDVVGRWRLTREVSQTAVTLGTPLQVKLVLEGRGNLQAVKLPPLGAPDAFKAFDPEVSDRPHAGRGPLGGTRVVEYTLMPQQTGTFTLPALSLTYFDPETRQYAQTAVDPVEITVTPGADGAAPSPSGVAVLEGPKNQLVAGGLKSLRHSATFAAPRPPLWSQGWFLPLALAPLALAVLATLLAAARRALGRESPEALQQRQARAARRRLAAAEKLLAHGSTTDFYAEVERALSSFMEARLGAPVQGLTRADLDARLAAAAVAEGERRRIAAVLDTCDLGRYAPGMGEAAARQRALDDAAAAMEGWG